METADTLTGTMIDRSLEWFGDLGSFSWKVTPRGRDKAV